MLIAFRFANFASFLERVELRLTAHRADKTLPGALVPIPTPGSIEVTVLSAAAIYGANAAGKSNVLNALFYLHDAVSYLRGRFGAVPALTLEPSFFESLNSKDEIALETRGD